MSAMGVMTVATTPSATRAEAMLRAAGGLGAGGWADAAELGAACAMARLALRSLGKCNTSTSAAHSGGNTLPGADGDGSE